MVFASSTFACSFMSLIFCLFLLSLLRPCGTRRFGQKKTRRLVPFPAEALAQAGWTEHETTCQRHVAATLSNHFKCARFSAVEVRLGIRDFSPEPLTLRIIPKDSPPVGDPLEYPQRRASGTPSLICYTNETPPCDKNPHMPPIDTKLLMMYNLHHDTNTDTTSRQPLRTHQAIRRQPRDQLGRSLSQRP